MRTKTGGPIEIFYGIRQMVHLAKQAQKLPESRKIAWREDMRKNRWKYFLRTPIFIALCVFFLWLGSTLKYKMGIIEWYIWMGLSSIFLIIGVFTFLNYLWLIIKGKK